MKSSDGFDEDVYVETIFGNVPKSDVSGWKIVEKYMAPIMDFYHDDEVDEIFVDKWDNITIQKNGVNVNTDAKFPSEENFYQLLRQIANRLGQVISKEYPILQAVFPNQVRICGTHQYISPDGHSMVLRMARKTLGEKEIIESGMLTKEMMGFIKKQVENEKNFIIVGNVGSGKTSLMRVMGSFIPKGKRLVTCEDTRELHIDTGCGVSLEAPRRDDKYTNSVTLEDLIVCTLRMGMDTVWVGEIRTAAAADAYIQSAGSGSRGIGCTIHGDGAEDGISKIQYLLASSGKLDYELSRKKIIGITDMVISIRRDNVHGRKVRSIHLVEGDYLKPIFIYDEEKKRHEKIC